MNNAFAQTCVCISEVILVHCLLLLLLLFMIMLTATTSVTMMVIMAMVTMIAFWSYAMVRVALHFTTFAITRDDVFGIDLFLTDLQCISILKVW